MASDIFRNIVEQKIVNFVSTFEEDSSDLFTKDKKLFHPLEYGMYKERCAKELLAYTLDKNTGISDGFLISSHNNVSTQCDIILYQKDTLPLIDNGITNFFPVEIVKGIGEVKSTLTKEKFIEALVKLAKNKKMFEERRGPIKTNSQIPTVFEEQKEIFSFLICNKLAFNILEIDFDEIYKEMPNVQYRHNMILSLQDGLFCYELDSSKFPPKQKAFHKEIGAKEFGTTIWYYPHRTAFGERYHCPSDFHKAMPEEPYKHIIKFLINISMLLDLNCEYALDIIPYLTLEITETF